MRKISHRGNLKGCLPHLENSPPYIEAALRLGYEVEIDVWEINHALFLGHDEPTYPIDISFLNNPRLWCHAKNANALATLRGRGGIHFFWHQEDDYTLTSQNIVWVYPGKPLLTNSIAVKPEGLYTQEELAICLGVCSDFIANFRE